MGPSTAQGLGERGRFATSVLILSPYLWEGSCALKGLGERKTSFSLDE